MSFDIVIRVGLHCLVLDAELELLEPLRYVVNYLGFNLPVQRRYLHAGLWTLKLCKNAVIEFAGYLCSVVFVWRCKTKL